MRRRQPRDTERRSSAATDVYKRPTLVVALALQTATASVLLMWRSPATLKSILRMWRPSMTAGFLGALASQFWFLAFAIQTAAQVRTLGLVEILFAQVVTRRLFKQHTSRSEAIGIGFLVIGVILIPVSATHLTLPPHLC
mgnify:CR=1 FL=1